MTHPVTAYPHPCACRDVIDSSRWNPGPREPVHRRDREQVAQVNSALYPGAECGTTYGVRSTALAPTLTSDWKGQRQRSVRACRPCRHGRHLFHGDSQRAFCVSSGLIRPMPRRFVRDTRPARTRAAYRSCLSR